MRPIPTTWSRTRCFRHSRGLGDFEVRGPGALQAYLRQAILNRVRDELRKKGRRPEATDLDGLEVDRKASPLEAAIGRESLDRYERALAMLRPDEREAIIGRVEMGYSYEELAEALGKPSRRRRTQGRAACAGPLDPADGCPGHIVQSRCEKGRVRFS